MSKYTRKWSWIFIFPFIMGSWAGCSDESPPPKNLIKEESYIDLLIELQLLESYRTSQPDTVDANVDSLKQIIYEEYGTTEQQFKSSHKYYQRQIEPQKERIAKAIDRLRQRMVEEGIVDSVETDTTTGQGRPPY